MTKQAKQGFGLGAALGMVATVVSLMVAASQFDACVPPWQVQSIAKAAEQHAAIKTEIEVESEKRRQLELRLMGTLGKLEADIDWIRKRLEGSNGDRHH